MSTELWIYLAGWLSFCVAAAILAIRTVTIRPRDALAFLAVPWKLVVFVPAILFVGFAGRFTDDETWDLATGFGMSILTVGTAWWAVGTAARVVRKMAPPAHLFVAIAVMLFASSWSYDGYLLLRDGAYTPRWLGNLMLSPTIYLCAGLVQNLEMQGGKLAFAFTRASWPRLPADRSASKLSWAIALTAIPLVAIAAWFLVGFVGWHLPR